MREHFAAVLLAGTAGILDRIPIQWAALLVIAGALLAGAGAMATFGEFVGHEARIVSLEEYREVHEDTVTGPGLSAIDALMTVPVRLVRIEGVLWCMQNEVARCPVKASNPFNQGGQP